MSTDIAYLQDLRSDLMRAATGAAAAPKRRRSLAVPRVRRPVSRWKLAGGLVTAVVVVAGVVGFLATGGPGGGQEHRLESTGKYLPGGRAGPVNSVADLGDQALPGSRVPLLAPGGSPQGASDSSHSFSVIWGPHRAPSVPGIPEAPQESVGGVPVIGPNIVKTGALEIQVDRDTFAARFQAAMAIAEKYAGYVQTSSTSGTKTHYGTMIMRVPADRFALAVGDLRELGSVLHQEISGVDVTAQFVDLGARLKNAEAQEASLRALLAKAPTVDATLRVNHVLSDVELRIEELRGQLRMLQNRADLGTIHLQMEEKGAQVALAQQAPPIAKPRLGRAFDRGVAGFLGVIFSVVVGLGYLLPVLLVGLVAWLVVRRVRRARVATA